MSDSEKDVATPSAPTVVKAVGLTTGAVAAVSMEADVRRNFSDNHLKAAAHIAEELHHHEKKYAGAGWGSHFDFCSWNASAAIILGFSAIEAAIDEAEDDLGLTPDQTKALDRRPTLDQAQALLAHCGSATFKKGAEPYQSADLLRALRNGLVHPKAEWDSARDRNSTLSQKIVGARLELSPFQPDLDLAFPHGCMSAGGLGRTNSTPLYSRIAIAPRTNAYCITKRLRGHRPY